STAYEMCSTNSNKVTTRGVTVSSAERLSNVLAPFTLDNTALASSAYANKSLINYIATPSQLEYTYWLSWPYASGSNASTAYLLNEALTSPMKLPTTVGKSTTTFYGAASNGAVNGYWWNQGVLNYATSTANHYNDWGADYVWLPSLSETGYSAADGLWATGKTTTGQIKFNNENTSDSATLAGTTVSTERVWLRSGDDLDPSNAQILSSSGTDVSAYSAATLAVRPALHLDLTSAAQAAVSNGQQTDGYEIPTPTAVTENYNGAAMWFTEFAKVMSTSDPTEPKYKWIDTALHTNSSIVTIKEIKYTPKNSNGAAGTQTTISNPSTSSVVHAGVYEVTLKLATGYKWRGQALDPNDSKTSEYTFTITVSQLEMKYDLNLYDHSGNKQSTGKGEYNADSYTVKLETASGTSTISGANLPDPKFYYKGSGTGNDYGMAGNKDGFVDDSTKGYGSATGPKNAGTYVATFVDQKTESDYILKANSTTASGSLTFEITKAKVKLPTTTWTPTYTGVSQSGVLSGFDSDILEVKSVKVTTMEGGTSNTKTLTDDGNGTYKDSNGNYEFYIDDSASIVKLFAKDAGDYTIEFDLVDTDNSEWDTSVATADKTLKFTVKRASLTIEFGAPGSTGFLWSVGDTGDITLSKADGTKNGEEATVKLYWYSDDDKTTTYDMFAGKVSDNEKYDITDFEDFGAGKYYICGVLADDTAGDNVNRNYIIDDKDTNVTPEKAEVKVQIATISAGSASLDSVIWQYKTPSTNPDAVTGNHIIYTTVSGTAVSYTVQVAKLPSYCEVVSYTNATYSDAGEHTTVVKIKIADDKTGDNKMPKPADG
ncbi:MAG: hypothetical protein K2N52_00910, partial [Clostridia bacterium]|nr:hypothetical protein [Clostridia bacterium]